MKWLGNLMFCVSALVKQYIFFVLGNKRQAVKCVYRLHTNTIPMYVLVYVYLVICFYSNVILLLVISLLIPAIDTISYVTVK